MSTELKANPPQDVMSLLEGKLDNPPGGTPGQVLARTATGAEWAPSAMSPTWGSITGTLSSQTDLNTALAGKAAAAHTHAVSDVAGLQSALDSKPGLTCPVVTSTDSALTPVPGSLYIWTCPASATLNIPLTLQAGQACWITVVVDRPSGGTLTAGSGLVFVDTPAAGVRSRCGIDWDGTTARLYVWAEEPLP